MLCSTNEIDKYKSSDTPSHQSMVTAFSCTAAYPKGAPYQDCLVGFALVLSCSVFLCFLCNALLKHSGPTCVFISNVFMSNCLASEVRI